MQPSTSRSISGPVLLLAAGLLAVGCSQGSAPSTGSNLELGSIQDNPANTDGFSKFIVEANKGGNGSALRIEALVWGRLVDVFDCKDCGLPTETRKPLFRDLLIDADIQSDGGDFLLELNPVSTRQELTILHPFSTAAGSPFKQAFNQLQSGLQPIKIKSLAPNELPPFTAVPRNGAVAVIFDDLLDPVTVVPQNLRVVVGNPPVVPYELRVVPDRTHGDLQGGLFRSTRAILDMTVSKVESGQVGVPPNALGLPGAVNTSQPNVALRIPTKINPSAAQFSRLQNLSGNPVAFTGNGPVDPGSPTLDVIRAFRSGGKTSVTLDPYDGFLRDDDSPSVLGSLSVSVTNINALGSGVFSLDMTYGSTACALTPRVGDLLELASAVLRVTQPGPPPVGALVTGLTARRIDDLSPSAPPFGGGAGQYKAPWNPLLGHPPACYVRFNPGPATAPATGVAPDATLTLTFDEPMNPEKVNSFDNFTITDPSVPASSPLKQRVVGSVVAGLDLLAFTFTPSLPFKHTSGQTETYNIDLISGFDLNTLKSFGATDLAGNHIDIDDMLPQVPFTLASSASTLITGGISLRFDSLDENGDGNPEVRGQLVYDLSRGLIAPRGVTRFDAWMDTTNQSAATVLAMGVVGPVVEPLSKYGSRLMTVWRYHDLGMPFFEDFFYNVDVEGLYWMVAGTGVQLDNFPEFKLRLSHSKYLPDEFILVTMMGPVLQYPTSGVTPTFADNVLDFVNDPPKIMAPKDKGYLIQPLDSVNPPGTTGIVMQPLPINQSTPVSQFTYWTYRDTAVTSVAGPFSGGADTVINPPNAQGTNIDGVYPAGAVPTIGLPMLLDFFTYPAPTVASGSNFLNLAGVNLGTFNLPFFRIHSTGGILPDNVTTVLIDPDQQTTAQGGLNSAGQPTPGIDSGFYYGGASFVTRVNRVHTIWFDSSAPSTFAPLVSEPSFSKLAPGTQMTFAFRGAANITPAPPAANGNNIDPYGNALPAAAGGTSFSIAFLNGDPSWKSSLAQLAGARFVQVRVTMTSNAETGVTPELSALGISYFQ